MARGIGAPQLVAEREPRKAKIVDALREERREAAPDPGKAARAILELAPHRRLVEVGEHGASFSTTSSRLWTSDGSA